MANARHLAELHKGIEAWNSWRDNNLSIIPDLSSENELNPTHPFAIVDSLGGNFKEVNFRGSQFENVSISEANCVGANFSGTRLTKVDTTNTNFDSANFADARFTDCDLRTCSIQKTEFKNTRLITTRFTGMDLASAKWQGAEFSNCNLQAIDFDGVKFNGASITGSDMRYCSFKGGSYSETTFKRNNFDGVEIRDADFSNAVFLDDNLSLSSEHFGGTKLLGITLPKSLEKFGALEHVTETSKHARGVFLALVGACFYTLLTLLTTTDAGLMTNTAGTPLPIINAAMPSTYFLFTVPIVLLVLFAYLHFYLQTMWEELGSLPAIFDDGRHLDKVAYPWLLTSLVPRYLHFLKDERRGFSFLKEFFSIVAAYGLVPLTIFAIWLRYLSAHGVWGDLWIGGLCLIATIFGLISFFEMRLTLVSGEGHINKEKEFIARYLKEFASRPDDYFPPAFIAIALMGSAVVLTGLSLWNTDHKSEFADLINAQLKDRAVSTKPVNWPGVLDNDSEWGYEEAHIDQVTGAYWGRRNLRGASAQYIFLINAHLQEADLSGARFWRGKFQKVDFDEADMRGTNFSEAYLQGAKMRCVDARDANFKGARLNGAKLRHSNLSFANFRGAEMANVRLGESNVTGADFTGAKKFDLGQLENTCVDKGKTAKERFNNKPKGVGGVKFKVCKIDLSNHSLAHRRKSENDSNGDGC